MDNATIPTLEFAQPAAIGLDPARLERAYTFLESVVAQGRAPGAVLLVGRRGRAAAPRAFGSSFLTVRRPMPPDAIFLVASVTKPVTVSAAMLLVERGQLFLDERVGDIIPEFAVKGKEDVRIWHLMTHTSGLPDMLPENETLREQHQPLAEFVKRICELELLFTPGTDIRYQSCGLAILAEVVERRTGRKLPEFLRREIFDPLGMGDTALGAQGIEQSRIPEINVGPEMERKDWNWNMPYWRNFGAPWGGMFTTAPDFFRYMQMFLNGGEFGGVRIFSPATIDAMIRDHTSDYPTIAAEARARQAWGLGWGRRWRGHLHAGWSHTGDLTSRDTFSHIGATGTIVWADPRRELVCILFTTQPGALERGILGHCSNLVAAAAV